jgi:16S rRNA (adenine1518-N6/adenine1519-N6)-dimethyltransferase
MTTVRPKKHLGQHFLHDKEIARRIVGSLLRDNYTDILEIGPGMGILTGYLLELKDKTTWVIDIDSESIKYLKENFPSLQERIIHDDFLKIDFHTLFQDKIALIGNLPYNISSQIFFKLLEQKDQIPEMICMIQKEVAMRITSPPRNKPYGIFSGLLGAFYEMEYLFTVKPGAFHPPPKVNSAVIRLNRNSTKKLVCDEALFFRVVKQGFQNRRKTLRNALKPLNLPSEINTYPLLNQRAEQLSVADFVALTLKIEELWKST